MNIERKAPKRRKKTFCSTEGANTISHKRKAVKDSSLFANKFSKNEVPLRGNPTIKTGLVINAFLKLGKNKWSKSKHK